MIYLPISSKMDDQFQYFEWLETVLGKASPTTWFWATHQMNAKEDEDYARYAIVFVKEQDASAFNLKFGIHGT